MPLIPSRENGYQASTDTPLSAAVWNDTLGDVHERLLAAETVAANVDTALDALEASLLTLVEENVAADIQAARDLLTQLQAEIVAAQDEIAEIIGGGIAATGVSVSAISGLSATNAQTAIAEVVGKVNSKPGVGLILALG